MSVAQLNNVATQNTYVDALTVQFAFPRPSFAFHVFNKAVFYQLAILGPADRDISWETMEHYLAPSLSTFRSPVDEGFPPNTNFAGIRIRSAVSDDPASVTVA